MPIARIKCNRCGLEATRIGYADRGMTSVDPDEWLQLCESAAKARDNGDPSDPLSVNCPHLQESAEVRERATR